MAEMKIIQYIGFYLIFFGIYGLVNFYIGVRGWQALPANTTWRVYYLALFLFVSFSFFIGTLFDRFHCCATGYFFVWIGSFWLAAMLYFLLVIVLFDIMRILNHFFAFYPQWITKNYAKTKLIVLGISAGTVLILLVAGYINARWLRVRTLDITIPKQAGQAEPVSLVLATDLHAGVMLGRAGFKKIVDKINALDPDAVLLAGDILDADLKPVLKEDFGQALESLKARLGVFACTGNHEYYGGIKQSTAYLSEHGIILLRDSSMLVDDRFYLVGREDKQREAFSGMKRTPLKELMNAVDTSYPVIVLDHQPYRLEEAVESGVDLQVSGHTHNGQLWPFGFITNRLFEIAYGYGKKGNTHFYVSSGAGTWGPPVRIGSSPEIVNIRVTFH